MQITGNIFALLQPFFIPSIGGELLDVIGTGIWKRSHDFGITYNLLAAMGPIMQSWIY
jgi:hypothetical protein